MHVLHHNVHDMYYCEVLSKTHGHLQDLNPKRGEGGGGKEGVAWCRRLLVLHTYKTT